MKQSKKTLLICLAVPLFVGGLSALLTSGFMEEYGQLNQPPLSPPGWVFPVVWTALYLAMGYASYLVLTADANLLDIFRAMILYGLQLLVNFLWPLLFFREGVYLAAFFLLLLLWLLIFVTMGAFARIRRLAGDLMLAYLLWVTFAAYLNFGVFLLN